MERYVVGTGRCGSTLLSDMLSCHPEALILSECLAALDRREAFQPGLVDKDELIKLLKRSNSVMDMTISRGSINRETLMKQLEPSRPAWFLIMLPFLTDKPDELFAEILNEVESFPAQTMPDHYRSIFHWLQNKYNKSFWIERSGESAVYVPDLLNTFPDAKFVHIHRHGPEVVMSMSKLYYFVLMTSFFTNPVSRQELLETEYGGKPVSDSDPISLRMSNGGPSLAEHAAYWNFQLYMSYQAFARMKPSQLLQVRFEDLINDPKGVMGETATFFEMPDAPGWIDKAAAMVKPGQVSQALQKLSTEERENLEQACMPGQVLLERVEHPWVYPLQKMIREMEEQVAD